jgi:Proteobacterial lipase chaperone protein
MKLGRLHTSNLSAVLLSALAIPLILIWCMDLDAPVSLYGPIENQWHQPNFVADKFPEHISNTRWTFDYEASEQVLLKLKLDQNGQLVLDERAAEILESAVTKLPNGLQSDELRRVEVLVAKGLPGRAGSQLAGIVTDFYRYQQATTYAFVAKGSSTTIEEQEERFYQTVVLQEKFFGKPVAKKLFGRKNALNRYLYARRYITSDSSLSPEKKQKQLHTLEAELKAYEQ